MIKFLKRHLNAKLMEGEAINLLNNFNWLVEENKRLFRMNEGRRSENTELRKRLTKAEETISQLRNRITRAKKGRRERLYRKRRRV